MLCLHRTDIVTFSYTCSCRNIHIYAGYIPTQWTTDAMIKTQEDFLKKYLPLTLLQEFEKVVHGLRVRGSWRPNRNCNILTPLLWPSTLCLSCSPDAGVHSAGCWLSLLHLISIFSRPQLIGAQRPLRSDVAFPTKSCLQLRPNFNSTATQLATTATGTRTQLNWPLAGTPTELYNR